MMKLATRLMVLFGLFLPVACGAEEAQTAPRNTPAVPSFETRAPRKVKPANRGRALDWIPKDSVAVAHFTGMSVIERAWNDLAVMKMLRHLSAVSMPKIVSSQFRDVGQKDVSLWRRRSQKDTPFCRGNSGEISSNGGHTEEASH